MDVERTMRVDIVYNYAVLPKKYTSSSFVVLFCCICMFETCQCHPYPSGLLHAVKSLNCPVPSAGTLTTTGKRVCKINQLLKYKRIKAKPNKTIFVFGGTCNSRAGLLYVLLN